MRESTRVIGALGLGVAAVSSAATVVLLAAPLPALLIASGRVFVTGAALLLLGAREVPRWIRAVRSQPGLAGRTAIAGTLLALHFGAWIASLSMTTVLRSTALVALQPVFAGLLGRVLGDRVSPWLYAGAIVSMGGTWLLVGGGEGGVPGGHQLGDALALVGAGAAAGYLAVGRSVRAALPLGAYLATVHLVAGAILVATAAVFVPLPSAVGTPAILAVVYLGLVPGLVGHGLFNWVVRKAPVDRVALAILLEPVGATLLTWLILGRTVTPLEVAGALVVLLGVGVGALRRPE